MQVEHTLRESARLLLGFIALLPRFFQPGNLLLLGSIPLVHRQTSWLGEEEQAPVDHLGKNPLDCL